MASTAGRGMDARPDFPTHRAMESGLLLYPPLAVHLVAKMEDFNRFEGAYCMGERDTYSMRKKRHITVSRSGNGTATASSSQASQGTTVNLNAIPSAGSEFERWEVISGNVTIINPHLPNASFLMTGSAVAVRAVFRQLSGESGQQANRFTDNTPVFENNAVSLNIKEAWYDSGPFHVDMFVTNGRNGIAYNIDVKSVKISNSAGIIAEGGFGLMQNAAITPGNYIIWRFVFSGDAVKVQNADLSYLSCEAYNEHMW